MPMVAHSRKTMGKGVLSDLFKKGNKVSPAMPDPRDVLEPRVMRPAGPVNQMPTTTVIKNPLSTINAWMAQKAATQGAGLRKRRVKRH
jgi:hypothetical protein